jgi:uncharacterized YigZ family protein
MGMGSKIDTYRSLGKPAEGSYRERNSRFLAFGFPVSTEDEAQSILAALRKTYHDARHHCYAYRLGLNKDIYRMNDDGEPSGSAGRPIYGQLVSHDLTQTLAVVVRYFGGTLLGTSGLIRAYRTATQNMLAHAVIVDRFKENLIRITFPYEGLSPVMKVLQEESLVPVHAVYEARCTLHIRVRESRSAGLMKRLSVIPGLAGETVQITD